jgi:hypothetical protein
MESCAVAASLQRAGCRHVPGTAERTGSFLLEAVAYSTCYAETSSFALSLYFSNSDVKRSDSLLGHWRPQVVCSQYCTWIFFF